MTYEEFKRAWVTDQKIDEEILWEKGNRARDFGRGMARCFNEAFFKAFTGKEERIPETPEPPEIQERRRIASEYIELEQRVLLELAVRNPSSCAGIALMGAAIFGGPAKSEL